MPPGAVEIRNDDLASPASFFYIPDVDKSWAIPGKFLRDILARRGFRFQHCSWVRSQGLGNTFYARNAGLVSVVEAITEIAGVASTQSRPPI